MVLQNAVEDEVVLLVLFELVQLLLHLVQHQVHRLHPLLQPRRLRLHLQKLGFVLSPLNMESRVKTATLSVIDTCSLVTCAISWIFPVYSTYKEVW